MSAMADKTQDVVGTVRMVCMGMRFTNEELRQHWQELKTGTERVWGKPLVTYARPGQVFEFSRAPSEDPDAMVLYSTGKYAPVYVQAPDCFEAGDTVLDWQAAHDLAKQRAAAFTAGKKAAKDGDPLRAMCMPLRRALAKRKDYMLRMALLEAIKLELNRPLTKDEQED